MKIDFDEEDAKPEPRKHVPQMKLSGLICAVCRKMLGSQDQDQECPGPQE